MNAAWLLLLSAAAPGGSGGVHDRRRQRRQQQASGGRRQTQRWWALPGTAATAGAVQGCRSSVSTARGRGAAAAGWGGNQGAKVWQRRQISRRLAEWAGEWCALAWRARLPAPAGQLSTPHEGTPKAAGGWRPDGAALAEAGGRRPGTCTSACLLQEPVTQQPMGHASTCAPCGLSCTPLALRLMCCCAAARPSPHHHTHISLRARASTSGVMAVPTRAAGR